MHSEFNPANQNIHRLEKHDRVPTLCATDLKWGVRLFLISIQSLCEVKVGADERLVGDGSEQSVSDRSTMDACHITAVTLWWCQAFLHHSAWGKFCKYKIFMHQKWRIEGVIIYGCAVLCVHSVTDVSFIMVLYGEKAVWDILTFDRNFSLGQNESFLILFVSFWGLFCHQTVCCLTDGDSKWSERLHTLWVR